MYQLKYNSKFNKINKELVYWTKIEELPNSILKFLNEQVDNTVIEDYDNNIKYCSKCFNKLDNNYCNYCNKKYEDYSICRFEELDEFNSKSTYYFFFYVLDKEVLLYRVVDNIEMNYYFEDYNEIVFYRNINIDNIINIRDNYLIDLLNNKKYSKEKYSLIVTEDEYQGDGTLYTNNLIDLKDTVYKYSFIWEASNHLNAKTVELNDLIYYPLCNDSFEYLIKYRLYNLAFHRFEFKGSFINTFGVGKDYLDFMVENNINNYELEILKIVKKKDIKLIKSLSRSYSIVSSIVKLHEKYKIDILKLKEYFDKNKFKYRLFKEYLEYIETLSELGFDIKNKNILYPKDFENEYIDILDQYHEVKDERTNKMINRIGNILEFNKYEDDNYIIYPPKTVKEFITESVQQHNCLRTYIDSYISGDSQIFFLRDKKHINDSLVTIEVFDNHVIQALTKYNLEPGSKYKEIINNWEKNLIPIHVGIDI